MFIILLNYIKPVDECVKVKALPAEQSGRVFALEIEGNRSQNCRMVGEWVET